MANVIKLIKNDHQTVEGLFGEFEQAGDRAYKTKQGLVAELTRELVVHATLEEELFYPQVLAKAKQDGKELIHEGVEEHHLVKVTLGELAETDPEDDRYDAKVQVLMENVRHHVEEEESEMLPQAEDLLGADLLEKIGQQWEARKQQLSGG